jgi:cytochrome c oxidase cbb3-type subunit 3
MAEQSTYGELMDHEYDGIREYDNPLPGWWTWIFWVTVVFSAVYVFYFHGAGPSIEDRYQAAVARHVENLLAQLGVITPDNRTIVEFMGNEDWMSAMGGLFKGNCSQCHAVDGGGNVGPNLTDEHYKNVTEPADIFRVINEGVAGTSMKGWSDRLREPQMILLAAYVATLRGTEPAVPKEAEGDRIAPWPALDDLQEPEGGESGEQESTEQ